MMIAAQPTLPYLLLSAVAGGLALAAVRAQRKTIKLTDRTWNDLVDSIEFIDFRGVSLVARDYLEPRRGQIDLEPEEIWSLLGGESGLRAMKANADRLIALAAFTQQ